METWAYSGMSQDLGLRIPYLEVHCTYNLLSNYSYNPNISPMTTVSLDLIGL